jgi:hypothetical protein
MDWPNGNLLLGLITELIFLTILQGKSKDSFGFRGRGRRTGLNNVLVMKLMIFDFPGLQITRRRRGRRTVFQYCESDRIIDHPGILLDSSDE